MTSWGQKIGAGIATLALVLPSAPPGRAQSSSPPQDTPASASQDSGFVLKMNGELVLTNVVVRDAKTGEVVRGLQQSDFSIAENSKTAAY